MTHEFIDQLSSIIGRQYVLSTEQDKASYLTDGANVLLVKPWPLFCPKLQKKWPILLSYALITTFRLFHRVGILDFAVAQRQMTAANKLFSISSA